MDAYCKKLTYLLLFFIFFIHKTATAIVGGSVEIFPAPQTPSNFSYSIENQGISIFWAWGSNSGGPLPYYSSVKTQINQTNNFIYPQPLPCSNCNNDRMTHFEIEVSENSGPYRRVTTSLSSAYRTYYFSFTGAQTYRFRIKAVSAYTLTIPYTYKSSQYLTGPLISISSQNKLNKPTISPSSQAVTVSTPISISSSQTASIIYKLVNKGSACGTTGFNALAGSFTLSSSKRVCAKATKSGWLDSDIAYKDYSVTSSSQGYASVTTSTPTNQAGFNEASEPIVDNIGTIKGQAGVSGGAATYHIPIELPPGRADM